MFMGKAVGKVSDPETRDRGGDQGGAVVGLEAPLRMNRDDLVAIQELPGFGALHERLMFAEFLGRLGRSMCGNIVRAREEIPIYRSDASRDQIGVLEVADPDRTVIALRYQIDEAIRIAGLDVE